MTKTSKYKRQVLGSFLVPEIHVIFGNGARVVALMAQLVWRYYCGADSLPVMVRFPTGP